MPSFYEPVPTVVASATAANDLTASINPDTGGKTTLVFGIDVSYTTAGSNHAIELQDGGSPIWAKHINDGKGRDGHFDFGNAPLIVTRGNSLQLVCPQPGGTADGVAVVRYKYEG